MCAKVVCVECGLVAHSVSSRCGLMLAVCQWADKWEGTKKMGSAWVAGCGVYDFDNSSMCLQG